MAVHDPVDRAFDIEAAYAAALAEIRRNGLFKVEDEAWGQRGPVAATRSLAGQVGQQFKALGVSGSVLGAK